MNWLNKVDIYIDLRFYFPSLFSRPFVSLSTEMKVDALALIGALLGSASAANSANKGLLSNGDGKLFENRYFSTWTCGANVQSQFHWATGKLHTRKLPNLSLS